MLLCFLLQQQHLTFYDSKSNFMFMMKIPFMTCILLGMEHKKNRLSLKVQTLHVQWGSEYRTCLVRNGQ